ncbi:MAG: hypothetical protein R3F62_08205 [Planctomycetota bacterium]
MLLPVCASLHLPAIEGSRAPHQEPSAALAPRRYAPRSPMTDATLSELERRWRASRSPEDEAAYLRERVRTGDLPLLRLEVAAWCGWATADLALGRAPDAEPQLSTTAFASVGPAQALPVLAELVGATWRGIPLHRDDAHMLQTFRRISTEWSQALSPSTAKEVAFNTSAPGLLDRRSVAVDVVGFLHAAQDAVDTDVLQFRATGAAGYACLAATWAAALGDSALYARCLAALVEALILLRRLQPDVFRAFAPQWVRPPDP